MVERKHCARCSETKASAEFSTTKGRPDGLATYCRPCTTVYQREYYHRRKEDFTPKRAWRRAQQREQNRSSMEDLLKLSKCKDCGNADWRVLEFDHLEGFEKLGNVGDMVRNRNWSTIEKEISKCDIVCANCHRLRTYLRFGSYRIEAGVVE